MIKGNIAIPDRDPKSWRSKGRKRRQQPTIASAIVAPARADEAEQGAILAQRHRKKGPHIRLLSGAVLHFVIRLDLDRLDIDDLDKAFTTYQLLMVRIGASDGSASELSVVWC